MRSTREGFSKILHNANERPGLCSPCHRFLCSPRPATVLQRHSPMVHRKVRSLLLLEYARLRSGSSRSRSIPLHRARRISYANQTLYRPPHAGRTASNHVLRLCHHRRIRPSGLHIAWGQCSSSDLLMCHVHPCVPCNQQAPPPRDRGNLDNR